MAALDDPDAFVPGPLPDSGHTEVDFAISEAFQEAQAASGFSAQGNEYSVLASGRFPAAARKTILAVGVAETTASGIRSRAMAVRVSGPNGSVMGTQASMLPSMVGEDDPRPLFLGLNESDDFPSVDGTLVWVDAAGGTLDYTYKLSADGAPRRAHQVIPDDGLMWLAHRQFVTDVSVRGVDGVERWHGSAS